MARTARCGGGLVSTSLSVIWHLLEHIPSAGTRTQALAEVVPSIKVTTTLSTPGLNSLSRRRLLAALLVVMRPLRSAALTPRTEGTPPPLSPPLPPTPRQRPGQHHWAPTSLSLNSPGRHPLHTVPCPPARLAGVCCCWGGGGERQPSKRTSGSTVPQMHSCPRPHLDPQRPLPLFHARVRVGTEEPGSGPGSCWVTLSKSLPISEPQIPGCINAGPRPAEGLWFLQAHRGPSTNERLPPRGRGLTPPRWSPPAHHPGV